MTHTPDKTRSVGETAVSARPVSEERLEHLAVMHFNVDFLPSRAEFVDIQLALRELQSLRAEVERLLDRIASLEARNASLEKDAGRYRWLRDARYDNDDWYVTGQLGQSVVSPLLEVELDDAIDAAIKERV